MRHEFTFTNEQNVVVAEAHGTFAAEAPDLVDTHSVGTDTRDLPALVDICTKRHTECENAKRSGLRYGSCTTLSSPTGFPVWMSMMKPGAWFPHSN